MQTNVARQHFTPLGACAALSSLLLAAPVAASLETLVAPKSLSVEEEWAPTLLGEGIGRTGLNVADLDGNGTLEIVAGATQEPFTLAHYWYVLSPSSGGYEPEWVSPLYEADISAIRTGDLDGLPGAEIVVAASSEILVYDGATRALLRTIETRTPQIVGLTVADADGDGDPEFAFCGSDRFRFGRPGLHIYDATTGEEEYYGTAYPCWDVAVGNVDHDPALEIVLGSVPGYVLDGATRALEWTYDPGFGRMVEVADVDEDGLEEVVVGGTWGTGYITVFDADVQSFAWEIRVFAVDAMLVADLDGDGRPEIVYGDEQWGSVHVWDTRTPNPKWQIENPEHGVAALAAGDTDGDGASELLWGAGYSSTGPDLLCVASTNTRRIEWQSSGVRGPFGALDAGDVDLDGEPELLYGSDTLFVHDARAKVLESELGPPAPATAWIMFKARHAEVDADPQPEIFTGGYWNFQGVIVCRDGITHAEQWRWTGSIPYSLEVADIDSDGHVEVVAGLDRTISVLDAATGVEEWQSEPLGISSGQLTMLRIANVDDDPQPEILVAFYGGLYIYDGVTHVQELKALELNINALDVFDRDGDGTAEVLIGTSSGRVEFVDPSTGAVTETLGRLRGRINAIAAIDLTDDFVPELVVALDEEMVILDGRYPNEPLWSSGLIGGSVGEEDGLLVGDLDEDGRTEILVNLGLIGVRVYEVGAVETEIPPGPYLESPELPGFRFKVRITSGDLEIAGTPEADCIPETLCVGGALPGRSELFLRLIGPRPNGYFWVNLVRFTPSRVEVWVERTATGQVNRYELPALPFQDTQLAGLVDKRAFWMGAPARGASAGLRHRPVGARGISPLLTDRLAEVALDGMAGAGSATSDALPGFAVSVRILAGGVELPARFEEDCLAETVCVSGALPGRSELFLRIIGPRPNGHLWVNLVRFTTSRVEIEIEQIATGVRRTYVLGQVPPLSDQLPGRLDREAFSP